MSFDFDTVIDRHNTDCIKFDFAEEHGVPADALPMWVADMDFRAPDGVLDAARACVEHGIFGYTGVKPDYYEAVGGWFERRFGWQTKPEWLVRTPGVVFALAMAVRALSEPGAGVLIQPPVYYPFFKTVRDNGRRVIENPLIYGDGRYVMDYDGMERAIVENGVKLFILCSPHNPAGRVWTREELRRAGDICLRHGVTVVSDEIHCDFTWPDHPHTPLVMAVPELMEQAVVCTAPSKAFNLAGLQVSNLFIPGADVRKKVKAEIEATGWSGLNNVGQAACKAAYRTGDPWLDALKDYLKGNVAFMRDYLAENLPELKLIEPEGTYLAWVDCSALGLTPAQLHDLVANKAKLWLDDGGIFGKQGEQFQRFVLACPRATLKEGLERLRKAIKG
ncbi:MAG: pyridoxal phosphate-dependent aminotransferase [Clostridia bacterium]|nr:pyridoxal phosphate-dependent aminotransferase [Clostridia bacterium]